MYKVFFNDRRIFLDDTLPDMTKVGKDYVCAFENITDLKPQVRQFLDPQKKGDLYIFHDDQDSLFRTFSQCFINVSAGGGVLKNSKGKLLVIFRRGKWDLPKGKAEEGETIEQTALREVEEECGLEGIELRGFIESTYHIYNGPEGHILKKTNWYSMFYPGQKDPVPATGEDISEVRWIDAAEAEKIYPDTFPTLVELIRKSF
jgi:8-oxo-dGTP pyrophosphatase MutT (NUDIX family)